MTDNAQIRIVPEPISATPLVVDYLTGRGEAPAFFPGPPHSLASYREKLAEVSRRFGRAERERAARAVRPTSDRARARLQTFVEEGGAMITTGQQAGLFTGPLYTVYKAITAARLARTLEEALGVAVVPVFWVASEDHDWEEVNHVFLGATGDGVHRLALPDPPATGHAMGDQPLGSGVLTILDELAQFVGSHPFASDVDRLVRGAYEPGETVAGAFGRLMGEILAPFDVCMTDAADPVVKEASAPVLAWALAEAEDHEARLAERTRRLAEAGYPAQVSVLEGGTNVFHHGPDGRARLYRAEEGFRVPESGASYGREALLRSVAEEPGRYSPNVFLRPIVESAVFPTLAYVAGPGEISYFAQVTALFPAFDMAPPLVYPRGSVTLIEPAMQRLLDKLSLTVSDLGQPLHELVDLLARRAMPEEIGEIVGELSRSVTEGYGRLIEVAGAIDPTLDEALASLRNQVLARIGDSEKKVVRQLKRREEITVGQLERVRANLRPEGEPQDRVLNVVPFLARHGPELLQAIAAHLDPELA